MKLNAIGLFVEDLGLMKRFYKDVMGMKQNIDMDGFAGFETENGFYFNLCDRLWMTKENLAPFHDVKGINGKMELSFGVESFEEVDREFKRLIEAGAQAFIEPNTKHYGAREAYVADTEGNLIEIVCFEKEAR